MERKLSLVFLCSARTVWNYLGAATGYPFSSASTFSVRLVGINRSS